MIVFLLSNIFNIELDTWYFNQVVCVFFLFNNCVAWLCHKLKVTNIIYIYLKGRDNINSKYLKIWVFYYFSRTVRKQEWSQQNQSTGRVDDQAVHTYTMESLLELLKAFIAGRSLCNGLGSRQTVPYFN